MIRSVDRYCKIQVHAGRSYGTFRLDMNRRLDLDRPTVHAEPAITR